MENKKKVVAFVPMKLNNERLPGKNTKAFKGGKPLLPTFLTHLQKLKVLTKHMFIAVMRKLKSIFLTALNFLKEAKALTHQAL